METLRISQTALYVSGLCRSRRGYRWVGAIVVSLRAEPKPSDLSLEVTR